MMSSGHCQSKHYCTLLQHQRWIGDDHAFTDGVGCFQLTGHRLIQLPADSRLPLLLLLLWCAADVVDDENAEDDEVMKSSSIVCPGGEQVLHGGGCRKVMKAERKLWLVIGSNCSIIIIFWMTINSESSIWPLSQLSGYNYRFISLKMPMIASGAVVIQKFKKKSTTNAFAE